MVRGAARRGSGTSLEHIFVKNSKIIRLYSGPFVKEENEYGVTGIGNPFLPHWAGGDDPICTDEELTCNRH